MEQQDFGQIYSKHPHFQIINYKFKQEEAHLHLNGLRGSSPALLLNTCFQAMPHTMLVILSEKEEAAYFYNDLLKLQANETVEFFPSSYKPSVTMRIGEKLENNSIIERTEILTKLTENKALIVVSYPESLIERVSSPQELKENTLELSLNETVSINSLVEVLHDYGFERVDFVYEPGQYAVRGSIVDIFSYANDYPYRLDFFGDDIESIRTFDIDSQLSKASLNRIAIVPNILSSIDQQIAFLDFISKDTIIWAKDTTFIIERMNQLYNNALEANDRLITGNDLREKLRRFRLLEFGNRSQMLDEKVITLDFNTTPQPRFQKNFELLAEELQKKTEQGYQNLILSDNQAQIDRLKAIFSAEDLQVHGQFDPVLTILHEGFIDNDLKICCYTDHEIFERYHKFILKDRARKASKEALTLKDIHDLKPGDYVVHIDHGIGKFAGMQKTEHKGKVQEAIRLIYRDNDLLLVNIHSLHRISKYKGKEGNPPKIHKLGSGIWQRQKQKTKSKVKDIAKELIALYAKRKAEKGFAFSADTYLQHALESSFIFEDTADQVKATSDVKQDMESLIPMDRLICGDVGFGKTEVAIRAAFKAVTDSKQVAVLVPTTILAMQHYHTFKERLKDFPCTVDYICRLRTTKDQREVLKETRDGRIDILIGTHRIVSKDVKFKNLGLLVIDEEQKFGVSTKEKLKQLKVNVDTLTLTATPIPRTLQFSLMGARDLSIIQTPPPNRYPIITELHTFNDDVIREAINYETDRNGQVFFINNRVQNIYEIEALVNRICPHARTAVAHGQMDGIKLEKIMMGFINHSYDVLIATTIIESGLDIPNANTIIINQAQNFGLSELHQLRGRVGRSNKKAFCFLLAPPLSVLPQDGRRRLKAIENFSELGSGFNIALQDLDIRGAGNLLGGEQSGFIADIGFETYQRILNEALLELRENEFKKLYETESGQPDPETLSLDRHGQITHLETQGGGMKFVADCQIDTDMELLFPESYISNISERLKLYRELDNIENESRLQEFERELVDRFGSIPELSQELLQVVRLRWLAIDLGIEKIVLKSQKMICFFVSNQESAYYQSIFFTKVLNYVQKYPKNCRMKQDKNRLSLILTQIIHIKDAIKLLQKITDC